MCDLATATLVVGGLSGAFSVYSGIKQSDAAADAANYQAAQARNNAVLAQRAADDARQRGLVAADQTANKDQALAARQVTALAGNGVEVGSGSALDLQADAAGNTQFDVLTVKANAEREALSYEAQGSNYSATASLDSASASNIQSAAPLNAVGSLLGSAGTVATRWYEFNNPYGQYNSATSMGSGLG